MHKLVGQNYNYYYYYYYCHIQISVDFDISKGNSINTPSLQHMGIITLLYTCLYVYRYGMYLYIHAIVYECIIVRLL